MQTPILDRRYQLDWRSLDYPVGTDLIGRRPRSYTWNLSHWFDQGQEGACVAFALSHELSAKPQVVVGVTEEFARGSYHQIQHIDEWLGCAVGPECKISQSTLRDKYEGTSVLAGAKYMTSLGFYSGYRWGLSLEETVLGLGYDGPAVLGLDWSEGMFEPDEDGFLHPIGRWIGGHAIAAIGVKIKFKPGTWWRKRTWADVDLQRSYVLLHNSWGRSWGQDGRAKLSLADLGILLDRRGDAMFPVRTGKRNVLAA